jgi:hypothetical protein
MNIWASVVAALVKSFKYQFGLEGRSKGGRAVKIEPQMLYERAQSVSEHQWVLRLLHQLPFFMEYWFLQR